MLGFVWAVGQSHGSLATPEEESATENERHAWHRWQYRGKAGALGLQGLRAAFVRPFVR